MSEHDQPGGAPWQPRPWDPDRSTPADDQPTGEQKVEPTPPPWQGYAGASAGSPPWQGPDQPSPFSREGAATADPAGGQTAEPVGSSPVTPVSAADPYQQSSTQSLDPYYPPGGPPPRAEHTAPNQWPSYPAEQAPSSYPSAPGYPAGAGYPPQSIPPYGAEQPPGYGPAQGYGTNPYDNGYSAQPYGRGYGGPYGFVPQPHPRATTAMVMGILGLVLCPFVGIAGLVMGNRIRKEIDAEPARYSGRGMATAGYVLGIISVVYSALVVVYVIIMIIAVATSGSS